MWHVQGLSAEVVTNSEALKELCPLVPEASQGEPGHVECWIASSRDQVFSVRVRPVDKARALLFNKLGLTLTELRLCLSVEVYLDGLFATSRLLSPDDLETYGAELTLSGHVSPDGRSERPFCFTERQFASHKNARMVSSEHLGTIKVVLEWRRWIEVDRSSPLSECGPVGFDPALSRAHRSLKGERYADVAALGDPRPVNNENATQSHLHEPLLGVQTMVLLFHYAPQTWLVSSGKDNQHPMVIRRTTVASSSKHTLDQDQPSNTQVKKQRRSYPTSSVRPRAPPANAKQLVNPRATIILNPSRLLGNPRAPLFALARPPQAPSNAQPEAPNGLNANTAIDSDIIDIDDLESDDDAPRVVKPRPIIELNRPYPAQPQPPLPNPNPNPRLTLANLTARATSLSFQIQSRPLPPIFPHPHPNQEQPSKSALESAQINDRILILHLSRLIQDFQSLLGASELDVRAREVDEAVTSCTLVKASTHVADENARSFTDLMVLELERLVRDYLGLGRERERGKRRAA